MTLPDPLSFPVQITNIESSGPDSTNKYTFVYTFVRTNPPNNNAATFTATVRQDVPDQYPIGTTLTMIFDLP